MPRIYLDHNAGGPLVPEAREAMAEAMERPANPSSVHEEGRRARDLVERARQSVAALVGASRDDVVFTSGGTEANALALRGAITVARRRLVVSAVEHPSIRATADALAAEGSIVTVLPVGATGHVSLGALEAALAPDVAPGVALVSVQAANHETGVLQPLAEIAARTRNAGVPLHVDAVQAAGKVALPLEVADFVSVSAHKLGGPAGAGALVARAPLAVLAGGHQERGRRGGTENLVGICGFGAAARVAHAASSHAPMQMRQLRDRLEAGLVALGGRVHGGEPRAPGTLSIAFPGVPGDVLVQSLDLAGIAASTGAACTSGTIAPSPVLLAMGLSPAEARQAVRFSLGPTTTAAEIAEVLAVVPQLLARIRRVLAE